MQQASAVARAMRTSESAVTEIRGRPPAMHRWLLAALWLAIAPAASSAAASGAERPPNIVWIVSDDHGWGDYSFMGQPRIRTPQLDRLASQSLVFRRGYSVTSMCRPSLAAMLTGRYPHQTGITSNDPPRPRGRQRAEMSGDAAYQELRRRMNDLIGGVPTLPRLLAGRGYVSFQAGKWWEGHFSTGGFTHGMSLGDPAHGGRSGDAGLAIGRETMQPIFDFVDRAQRAGRPFFVWYAPMLPHAPHDPPERLLARHRDEAPTPFVARYWASVEWFDETCGRLLEFLDERGLRDDTIVVYAADNGWVQSPDAEKPLRSKGTAYDAGVRTPILIRWPGRVAPQQSDRLASTIDLAPTLLNAAGIAAPADMPGVDLLDAAAVARREAIFGEIFRHSAVDLTRPAASLRQRWLVAGDWKLIVPDPTNSPHGEIELYQLAADPAERENLAARESARVELLRGKLDEWWRP
jgi:uncharacterized sulfatase